MSEINQSIDLSPIYKSICDQSEDGFIFLSEGLVVHVNQKALIMLECDVEEIENKHINELSAIFQLSDLNHTLKTTHLSREAGEDNPAQEFLFRDLEGQKHPYLIDYHELDGEQAYIVLKKGKSVENYKHFNKRVEKFLDEFQSETKGVLGETFNRKAIEIISRHIESDFIFFGEITDEGNSCVTSNMYADGNFTENIVYDLKDTPCDLVSSGTSCFYPNHVQSLFPNDLLLKEMGIEGYAGLNVIANDHNQGNGVIIVALFKNPIENELFVSEVLNQVRGMIAHEMERSKIVRELEASKLENELRSLLQNTMLEHLGEGVLLYNSDYTVIECNSEAYRILGIKESDVLNVDMQKWEGYVVDIEGNELSHTEFPAYKAIEKGKLSIGQIMGIKSKDKTTWIKARSIPLEIELEGGKKERHALTLYKDISDNILFEKTLKTLSVAFEAMKEGIVIQDQNSKIIEMNEAATEIMGLTKAQMEGRDSFDPKWKAIREDGSDFPGDEHPAVKTLRTGSSYKNIIMGVHKADDSLSWISVNTSPLFYTDSKIPKAVVATFSDITESVQEKNELNLFHEAIEQLEEKVLVTDNKGNILYANSAFNKTGFKNEELIGQKPSILNSGKQKNVFYKRLWTAITSGKTFKGNLINRYKDGSMINEEINITPVKRNGEITHFLAIYTDMEQKERAMEMERELTYKEVLIQELHHRVKNNLQIVSSLLSLQTNELKSEELKAIFNDARLRISAIALVHEKLYQTTDLEKIPVRDYLEELIGKVGYFMNIRSSIKQNIQIEPVVMALDYAVPLGLIFNEVISNVYKYAFNEHTSEPQLNVSLKKNATVYHLNISDNGKGIANFTNIEEHSSLGMKLIQSLSDQLNASMKIETAENKGMSYFIEIPYEQA